MRQGDNRVLYLLGPNGSGKSSLISRIARMHPDKIRRISAHRQNWFDQDSANITPQTREDIAHQLRNHNSHDRSRWTEWNPGIQGSVAIFDLINSVVLQDHKIANFARMQDWDAARAEANNTTPIQMINNVLRLSGIFVEIWIEDNRRVFAKKNNGPVYSITQMSDGERNAFLIAVDVLTSKPGTLILLDEPERHLHRSIVVPLLKAIFRYRRDCGFIVSTHELTLPIDTSNASILLMRGCEYIGDQAVSWTADLIRADDIIDDDLKSDLLGSRRRLLFVEGTSGSLDFPLYSLLFPDVSVIPKKSCRDVEYAVRGLRSIDDVHWIEAYGIVDNDQRAPDSLKSLEELGIYALPFYSVEALYYQSRIIRMVAARHAKNIGKEASVLASAAIDSGLLAAQGNRDHLIDSAVIRSAREKLMAELPTREMMKKCLSTINFELNVNELRAVEGAHFDEIISASDWDHLISRYPLRESGAFNAIAKAMRILDKQTYQDMVLKLLQDEAGAIEGLREVLGHISKKLAI